MERETRLQLRAAPGIPRRAMWRCPVIPSHAWGAEVLARRGGELVDWIRHLWLTAAKAGVTVLIVNPV